MKVEGVLEKLQDAIENRLLELNELRNVPILTYKQSDLQSVFRSDMKSGIGTAILLMPPVPNNVLEHVAGPVFSNVSIEVKIIENTATNKHGKSLLFLAEVVMRHLHMWHPNVVDASYRMELASGAHSCRATRENDTNYFSANFAIPCHLEACKS
ncbi:MAG: hypothetical protein LBI61_01960 [Puniceicoccales bacterium]|jgi:hypothetical protein|nr:hypothetical protein [Puniceicoccales bacterium]